MLKLKTQLKKNLKSKEKERNEVQKRLDEADTLQDKLYELDVEIQEIEGELKNLKHIVPTKGKFKAYKKAYHRPDSESEGEEPERTPVVITLEIPSSAKRITGTDEGNTSADGDFKSRVSHAKILKIESECGTKKYKTAYSGHDEKFLYEVGKTVKPKRKFALSKITCASGIHCFMDKDRALNY